ncbi:magnesium/cobalt transporter CorA [Desulfomonile tiedjei]|uniref:Magnesium transport protein CorA n=1 Tax=Desulfomonile tiedjei (strain ATCC 49306 / DSM 6799 / DCB-1) TaxID=706587 RepID=I4CAH1_DESTA|nr:magnesium/cobalt transporter CorA [Desulfomonile tiedjei]AFM26562.1 magnesium Mg(2+) and cobalt Co(2+) transport protein CorA [Desulfomonile tiedjei DSM 6799]
MTTRRPKPEKSQGKPKSRKRSRTSGLPPGTLVYIGPEREGPVHITAMTYDRSGVTEFPVLDPEKVGQIPKDHLITWINVDGLQNIHAVETIGKQLNIHPLVLEDIVDTTQRPKIEVTDDYTFIVFKTLTFDETTSEIVSEHVSLVLGEHCLITFQETAGDPFDLVRNRIRSSVGRLRTSGPDYLAYALIDAVVDDYFSVLEKLAEGIEVLEEDLATRADPQMLREIHKLKVDMIVLRRSVWPLREVLNRLSKGDAPLVQKETIPYLMDVYDHTIHVIETMETYRDIVSGMLDIYLSSISNRLNQIMKVLTIISTIFIPLTFLSGWYGMNFKYMPELSWKWGYPMVIVVALTIVSLLLYLFRRNEWI